ncbi:MAG: flagellar basal body protein [Desulfovibrio sp.]|jgi:flagellar basal-body rod protein FlgC|nr:flagellar basal body protein [Desulfovibrio sp.]
MPNYSPPISALNSLEVVMQTSANNIANVNTDGFKARYVSLETGPMDEGVRIGGVFRDMSPGPAVINHLAENDVRVANDVAARSMRNTQENYDTTVAQDLDRLQQGNTNDAWAVEAYREGQVARDQIQGAWGVVEGSNTDIARDFVNMISTENAYSANAAMIRAWDEMTGSILNIRV